MEEARALLKPVIEEREAARSAAIAQGEKDLPVGEAEEYNDALTWLNVTSRGASYDAAAAQMGLALAAIHTTTDLLTQTLYELAQRPALVQELREEAVSVLKQGGWRKQSLYEMKLMDSVLKETQRVKPAGLSKCCCFCFLLPHSELRHPNTCGRLGELSMTAAIVC